VNAPANINQAALCNIEIEQEVLGAALGSAFEVIDRAVSAGDFSEALHSQLFETFASVYGAPLALFARISR
jgi:replicative DNA helicase